jgi:hypothetical protein
MKKNQKKTTLCLFSILFLTYAYGVYGQIEKAKDFIKNSYENCNSANQEAKNALMFIDSSYNQALDIKSKERFIRLAESEIVSSKRMIVFAEDEAEKALKILEDECEKASESVFNLSYEITPIITNLEDSAIQLNMWLNEKELREVIDFTSAAKKTLLESIKRMDQLYNNILISRDKVAECP